MRCRSCRIKISDILLYSLTEKAQLPEYEDVGGSGGAIDPVVGVGRRRSQGEGLSEEACPINTGSGVKRSPGGAVRRRLERPSCRHKASRGAGALGEKVRGHGDGCRKLDLDPRV